MKIKIIYKFCFFLYLFHFSVLALPISPDGIGAIVEEKLRTEGYYFPNREIPLYAITDEGKFVHDFEYSIVYAKENFEDIQKGELCIQESG
ncbi:MAG TPA: hypothetical protein PLS71_19355, partial [Leptospiraceae bacterium]|nr:hypothetical protein [Leptospiraceae bacterium]